MIRVFVANVSGVFGTKNTVVANAPERLGRKIPLWQTCRSVREEKYHCGKYPRSVRHEKYRCGKCAEASGKKNTIVANVPGVFDMKNTIVANAPERPVAPR
jgi:hypothetical protein